jgi:hypothetical protein
MLKVVLGDTPPWSPVFVATSVSNASVRLCRALATVLSVALRVKGGNAGPRSGHGVKERAEEKSKNRDEAWVIETIILNN